MHVDVKHENTPDLALAGDGGPVFVHPVLDPPEGDEDAGVAEHDY